ncbi:transcription elongation factor GreA [Candidatus Gracilibacteria bacterium]|nr:MAG: transcription elongation factor GreA [Candidatus Gracilibacteria bacterium]PIE85820.1 MAG: transcription elongation factor GreA [Candidatus Gracilibacteria bacterium]
MAKIYLTQDGLLKLEDELKHLKEVKRVEIAQKLKEAIEYGDLSENAEYEEARNEQAQVEVRISELELQLKDVEIISDSDKKEGRVNMGNFVTILNLNDNEEVVYKVVGTTESDILAETPLISNESPIGKAILGKKKGDLIKINIPSGKFEYKIIDVK